MKLNKERIEELSEEFIHYDELRSVVDKEIGRATGKRLGLFLEIRQLLDLSADAAERCEGYALPDEDADAINALSEFLR